MGSHLFRFWVWLSAALVGCSLLAAPVRGHARPKRKPDLRVAFTAIGLYWVDRSTVEAAARPLIKLLVDRAKASYSCSARIGDFTEEAVLLRQLHSGAINVAYTSPLEYVRLSKQAKLRPMVRSQAFGKSSFKLLILTRKGAGIRDLKGLKGKRISFYGGAPLNKIFLTVALRRQGLGEPASFFSDLRVKQKPQSAVLDLLMRETDACVVTDVLLNTMARLNPQLQRKLAPIVTSRAFANAPLFATEQVKPSHLKLLREVSLGLHKTRSGRQLLLIFRMERFVPTRDEDYATFRALWREYNRLSAKDAG